MQVPYSLDPTNLAFSKVADEDLPIAPNPTPTAKPSGMLCTVMAIINRSILFQLVPFTFSICTTCSGLYWASPDEVRLSLGLTVLCDESRGSLLSDWWNQFMYEIYTMTDSNIYMHAFGPPLTVHWFQRSPLCQYY